MTTDDHAELVRFIRETLGCGCPDEVLRSIRCSAGELVSVAGSRLDVGGRLLVWLLPAAADHEAFPSKLAAIVAAGLDERDRLGFNRLRLVLVNPEPELLFQSLEGLFAPPDDRCHLHVVAHSDVPLAALPV